MGDYLDKLSEFVADMNYEDLSPDAVSAVRDVTLDTVGAIIAGSRIEENAALARLVAERSGPATATIFGHGVKAEPMLATLVNATAGVALEMDEGNRFGGGHPAIHSLPGAVAVAEEMGSSGRQLVESILVGYEVESRIGGATRPRANVHSHGHWGTIGTAVSVAKLHNYDAGQVRAAINLAANMSPANTWTTAFRGATIRNLYPGRSGLQGILAVHLYECGFTGLDDGPSDVFGTIIGDRFDAEAAVEGLGGEYRIQQNYFKYYACCRINHAPLEAVLNARQGEEFPLDEVQAVDIATPRMLAGMLGEYPDSMLAAKFNVPYAVAAAIVRNDVTVNAFYPEAINEERIRDLAGKVRVTVDPEMANGGDEGPLARASIRLRDGRTLEGDTGIIPGDYGNSLPRQSLLDKFHFLNDDILSPEGAAAVAQTVDRLEQLDDVGELTSLLGG